MLADFPLYEDLSEADLAAWEAWINRKQVKKFIDSALVKCRTQAEINKEAQGYAVFKSSDEDKDGEIQGTKVIDNPLRDKH